MSARVNNALFDLIKSLTKSEKRYFKLVSSLHTIGEENNYIRLFDFIDQMTAYDEAELKIAFKGEPLLNRFAITKKRLYDRILNALDAYHSDSSDSAQLYKQLHYAEILYNRSLYDQCRRVLLSAEKLARKTEDELVLALILNKKKLLIETVGYSSSELDELYEISDNFKLALNKVSFANELWVVKSELFKRLLSKGIARNSEEIGEYQAICQLVFEDVELNKLDHETAYLINHIKSIYYYAIGDLNRSYRFLIKNYKHYNATTDLYKSAPHKAITIITNAIYIADRLGKHNEAIKMLTHLKQLSKEIDHNEDLKIKSFATYQSVSLSLATRMGDLELAMECINELELKLSDYEDKINPARLALIRYKMAFTYFINRDFSNCTKLLNEISVDTRLDQSDDLLSFSQLLELFTYIEQQKTDLINYRLKSINRAFKKKDRLYDYEKTILNFVSKWVKVENQFDRFELLEKLICELKSSTENDPKEALLLDNLDVISWAKSKLTGKELSACLRECYNHNMRTAS